ncbi:F-box only protein 9-like [Corticium candelabrum]|uniref:F-box only protein 9-like n=1 Tax=Corticium candelabrum TaxID=121492 RepID=UPI002E263E9F|nr:F-box only protein 9-like [Corticium candelabrum]
MQNRTICVHILWQPLCRRSGNSVLPFCKIYRVISSPFIGDVAIWQDQGTSAERFPAGILRLSLLFDRSVDELEMKVHCLTLQHNFVSCQPLLPQTMLHISSLPREILIYTFRWVVSSDLDMRSLEVLSLVCRGFCYCSRDAELWKLACFKMWGSTAVTKDESISWRQLFISQPHLLFDGVYICQTSYVRVGEPSLDEFYRPFHTVDCYRYLSFYSNGDVLYLNSPDTPVNCVHRLRARASARPVGLQTGHFQLSGDKVRIIVVIAMSYTGIPGVKEEKCKKEKEKNTRPKRKAVITP